MGYIGKELEFGGCHLFYLRIQGYQFTALFFLFLINLTQFAVFKPYLTVNIEYIDRQRNEANHQKHDNTQ